MAPATHTTDDSSTAVDVRTRLAAVDRELAALADELVPERVAAHVVNRVVGLLGKIERRAGGARLVLTAAAAESGAWRAAGARSPEDHAAQQNGTSVGEAKADLKASHQLSNLPAARDAAASGDLSLDKAKAVAEGATADPHAERSLLDKATHGDLQDVRDEARRARQRSDERDGKAAERMYRRRSLKTWLSLDGEGHGHWDVPPEYQAWFLAALEPYRQEAFRLARESGLRPAPEALMADALFMLARDVLADLDLPTPPAPPHRPDGQPDATAEGDAEPDEDTSVPGATAAAGSSPNGGTHEVGDGVDLLADPPQGGSSPGRSPPEDCPPDASAAAAPNRQARRLAERRPGGGTRRAPAQIVVHVDYPALARGFAVDGEMCEIVGIGPVPVALVAHMAQDALLRIILTGDDVTVISSERRYIPAALRRALEARDRECVVPGCHVRHHLEIDHTYDFALGGPTSLANTARVCKRHHALKTHCGWTLTGGPGHWRFEPP